MRRRWHPVILCSVLAPAFAGGAPAVSQSAMTLDMGLSTVRYDRFLPSGAGFVSPALRLQLGDAVLGARGTYLVFESGNHSLQGTAAGAVLGPRMGRLRLQAAGSAGASKYEAFPAFGHMLGELRLHYQTGGSGAWLGGGRGRAYFASVRSPISVWTAGGWLRHERASLVLSTTVTEVGDTSYTDFEGVARTALWKLELDAMVGARVWSRGGGRGVYGEVSTALPVRDAVALVASGGRYPTDPTRGSISGRYLTLGVRLSGIRRQVPSPVAAARGLIDDGVGSAGATTSGPRLDVGRALADTRTIRVHATGANRVELMADFTDWKPVALTRIAPDQWEIQLTLSPGAHRVNVRVDGGPWVAPQGTRAERDEFGTVVGIIVVW